jgi:ACR3 family arsenite efflux pump ArsB
MSANHSYWFSIAPWPFSAFSSFGEQVVLYMLSLGLGVGFTIIGMSIYTFDKMKDRISPANIPFVSVLRGVGALSVVYPLLIELYLEWLYNLPVESDGPYSLAFSNLLKGPFPMSWFASGQFLLAMYMSAVLFGVVLIVIAEIIRKKINTSSTESS